MEILNQEIQGSLKWPSIGVGLLLATAILGGCGIAGSIAGFGFESNIVEMVTEPEPGVAEVEEILPDGVIFESDEITVAEIPLFTLENVGPLTLGGEVMFEQIEAQSHSLADFAFLSDIPWWWHQELFFLNPEGLAVWTEDNPKFGIEEYNLENSEFQVGDYILEVDYEQFGFDWDAIDAYSLTHQDTLNGIPTTLRFFAFPDMGYFVFTPIEFQEFNGIQAIAVLNDDQNIDIQIGLGRELELIEASIVEDALGGNRIELRINRGSGASGDTAWRLTLTAQELTPTIRLIDATSDEALVWSVPFAAPALGTFAGDAMPNMLEIKLIPQLIETARQFAVGNGFSR